jgi:outer membrane protein assembly factor BamB
MNRCLFHPTCIGLLAIVLLAGGCGQTQKPAAAPSAADTAAPSPTSGLEADNFRQLWINVLPVDKGDAVRKLYVKEDLVLACTPNNVVYTTDKTSGVLKYFSYVNGGGRQLGEPVLLHDYAVYLGQSNVEVFKRKDGDLYKSIPLDFTISSNAVGFENDLFLGGDIGGGRLVDIKIADPYVPVRWSLVTFGEVRGAPAFFDNIVYVGSGDGGVRAVTLERTALWPLDHDAFNTGGQILGDLKVDDAGVYAASDSGRLVCVDRNTGKLKWQYLSPHPLNTGPIVTRDSVYQLVPGWGMAAIDKSKLMAVDPDGKRMVEQLNRTPRWICAQAVQFVAEDKQYVYVSTESGELCALDRDSGQLRYRGAVHFSAFATNTTDSTIYAATAKGSIFALKPELRPGGPGYLD